MRAIALVLFVVVSVAAVPSAHRQRQGVLQATTTSVKTTACPHPIGDFVFYDSTKTKGVIDTTDFGKILPFVMCQFPTYTDPEFAKLYNGHTCPKTYKWDDPEDEAKTFLGTVNKNLGAVSISRTLYSALAIQFYHSGKKFDTFSDLHFTSLFAKEWKERKSKTDDYLLGLNNFILEQLHGKFEPKASEVSTVFVESQVEIANKAMLAAGDKKIKESEHHQKLLARTIAFECAKENAGKVYIGRAVETPEYDSGWRINKDTTDVKVGESKPNSLSFCGSLLAGFDSDETACTYKISTESLVTYAATVSISEYLAKANDRVKAFFFPAVPTLMGLFANGEMWHPRSKFCSPDEYTSDVAGVKSTSGSLFEEHVIPDLGNALKLTDIRVKCSNLIEYAVSIHHYIYGFELTKLAAATKKTIELKDQSLVLKKMFEDFAEKWSKQTKVPVYLVKK